jgi:anti-sigma factor RsiW
MATEITDDDIARLNALVDGELDPAERAAMAARLAAERDLARAHATLAQLKATVSELAETEPAPPASAVRTKRFGASAKGMAAMLGALAILALLVPIFMSATDSDPVAESAHTTITLAALPANPVIPDLGNAGLRLAGLAMTPPSEPPALVATYQGPRGCRLELRVRPADGTIAPVSGVDRRAWTVGDLAYELVSFGLPAERFAVTSAAAERATRHGEAPGDGKVLREASTRSRPCLA